MILASLHFWASSLSWPRRKGERRAQGPCAGPSDGFGEKGWSTVECKARGGKDQNLIDPGVPAY